MVTAISDDIFSPEFMADPYTYFAQIREEDPVHWNEKYQVWLVTRHEDLLWLTRHPELFSSGVFKNDPKPPYPAIDESDMGVYEFIKDFFSKWMIQHDRPKHQETRGVVHAYFNPKSQESWRPMVRHAIKGLLDDVEDQGNMDLMRDFATPLPVLVIAQMMGMPFEDRKFIRSMAEKLLLIGRGDLNRMRPLAVGIQELMDYITPLVEERLVNPSDDLLSILANGEKTGEMTREEVVANAVLILFAGHETTINLICNGAMALGNHPDQWALLREDPAGKMKTATEECLRYDSPVKSLQRLANEDVELGGKTIKKFDRVRWFMTSANRDPEMFQDPDTFDITRHPNLHVAFGAGVHHCLGATLARLEGQEAFKALAERLPNLRLESQELEHMPSITFRTLKSLQVAWN